MAKRSASSKDADDGGFVWDLGFFSLSQEVQDAVYEEAAIHSATKKESTPIHDALVAESPSS